MRKTLAVVMATTALLLCGCGCSRNADTTNPNSTQATTITDTQAAEPSDEEVTVTVDLSLPFLSTEATDMTVNFEPQEGDPVKITVPAKTLVTGSFEVNLKKTTYNIHITPPKNPDGTTYDTSYTEHEINVADLANVTDTPSMIITGAIIDTN